jgi:hypothetical protein
MNLRMQMKFSKNQFQKKSSKNQSPWISDLKLTLQFKNKRHQSTNFKQKWIKKL